MFINENLDYERRGNHRYHLLAKSDLNHFLTEIDNVEQGIKDDDDEEEEELEDNEEDTDDELIQQALNRRLKSESTNSSIDEDHVSDSDMEDVISITRRCVCLASYIVVCVDRSAWVAFVAAAT